MKSILLSLPDGQAEVFTKRLVELMKECGVSAQITAPEAEVFNPEAGCFVAFGDDTCEENPFVGIFKEWYNGSNDKIICYAHVNGEGILQAEEEYWNADKVLRPATDEETEALIKALAKNGRRWNSEELEFEDCGTYEAIRTFEDALEKVTELSEKQEGFNEGKDNVYSAMLYAYYHLENHVEKAYTENKFNQDIIAFIKLRIIVAAINDGWMPKFVEGEYRWFPWFRLYTQAEIDAMSEEQRAKVLLVGGGANSGAVCGLACSISNDDFSISRTRIGARLAFSDKARAEYAGKRFIELYAALNFRAVERKAE